jgi:membrane protein involved in colicin uptake
MGMVADEEDDDVGLPYDREDHEPPVSGRSSGHRSGTPPTREAVGDDERQNLVEKRDSLQSQGEGLDQGEESVTAAILDDELTSDTQAPVHVDTQHDFTSQPTADALTPHADDDKANLPAQAADAVNATTHETALRQAEHEAEVARAAFEAAEAKRLAEEARVRIAEAEAAALEKERVEREAREVAEREAAEEAKKRQEEYEAEQQVKREQEGKAQEEKRRKEAEDAKHAAELAFEDNLRGMKGKGEMLRGVSGIHDARDG